MAKKIKAKVKLNLPAGKATPAPPVGPVVSPLGVNVKQFCDDFNNRTKGQMGFVIPIDLIVYEDKSYDLILKQPLMSNLIKKTASVEKGSQTPKTNIVAKLTKSQIDTIVDAKMADLNTISRESARKMVIGSARSMGIEVEE
jgi:large subunit ribosomal protein L11